MMHSVVFVLMCLLSTLALACGGGSGRANDASSAGGPNETVTASTIPAPTIVFSSATPPDTTPPDTTPPDTTPPGATTGLVAWNAYDGNVNLIWDRSTAEDFGSYKIYFRESEIVDTAGLTSVQQIDNIETTAYQMTGLTVGAHYFFAVTASDNSSNEKTRVVSVSATSTAMPTGTLDPEINVEVYRSDKAWAGTTLLADNHTSGKPRIIEVNMRGEIIWEYVIPDDLKRYTNPGLDVELLSNNNILFVLPRKGVYEINRSGNIVWFHLDSKITHDADRLPNGNTIYAFGGDDTASDAQVKEINPQREVVWSWYARDHFDMAPYADIYNDGWTHTNAIIRLSNGNTVISPRNFNFVIEVDPQGAVVRKIGERIFRHQHDPEILPNGNMLVANHRFPHAVIEIEQETGKILWKHIMPKQSTWPIRDADRLPNGNTLITGSTTLDEVTSEGEVVWQLVLQTVTLVKEKLSGVGFYKAERTSSP
jgi:hypothetical protein